MNNMADIKKGMKMIKDVKQQIFGLDNSIL